MAVMDRFAGEQFRFRFDPGMAYRLNEGMRGHDWDVRRDWRVIVNDREELVVYAGPIHLIVPRSSIVRVDYTDDRPDNGVPGAWPGSGTFWVVPSLSNLVAVYFDPPASGHYGQGEWSVSRVVMSLKEPAGAAHGSPAQAREAGPLPPAPADGWRPSSPCAGPLSRSRVG